MTVSWDIDADSSNGVQRVRSSTQNYLTNASAEHWLDGTSVAPNGWTTGGDVTISRAANPTIGSYAAQLVFGTANTGELYQSVGVSTLVDYTFSCYVERTAGTGAARLVAQDANSPYTEYSSVALSTMAGQRLALLTVKPSGSGSMRFAVKSGGTTASTWRVDECMVQESKAVATTFQPCMIDDESEQTIYGTKTLITPEVIAPTFPGISGLSGVRFVGYRATSGAPTTGDFLTGDMMIDGANPRKWWICTAGGTPGTWA